MVARAVLQGRAKPSGPCPAEHQGSSPASNWEHGLLPSSSCQDALGLLPNKDNMCIPQGITERASEDYQHSGDVACVLAANIQAELRCG